MVYGESLTKQEELDPQNRAGYWAEIGVPFATDFFLNFVDEKAMDSLEKAKMSAETHLKAAERLLEINSVKPKRMSGVTNQTLLESSQSRGGSTSYERMLNEVVEGRGNKEAFANTLEVWTWKTLLQDRLRADEGQAHLEMAKFLQAKIEATQSKSS